MNSSRSCAPPHLRAGFTLVEIMIVVVIIGLLAALAIPSLQRVQQKSKKSRFVNDLRIFTQAFEAYSLENGNWPPNVGAGVVPAGLTTSLQTSVWNAPTVLGGNWNYDRNINSIAVAVSVSGSGTDDTRMQQIDAILDDGDLTTGIFQKIGSRYMYILVE